MTAIQSTRFKANVDRSIILKSFSQKLQKSMHIYFHYSQDSCVLPLFFYYLSSALFVLATSIPPILPLNADMWNSGSQFTILATFLSFFWKFGGLWISYNSVIISVSILIGIFILVSIPNIIFSLIYFHRGRISKLCCFYSTLSCDLIIPILVTWFPSELGAMVHLFFTDLTTTQKVTTSILLCVVSILLVCQMFLSHIFLYPRLNYQITRSDFWIDSCKTYIYITMIIQLFLTEMIEIIDTKTFRTVLIILETLVIIFLLVSFYTNNFVISFTTRVTLISLTSSSFLVYILNVLQIYNIKFELDIAILLFLIGLLVFSILSYVIIKKLETRSLKIYDDLMEGRLMFESVFPTVTSFLNHSRIAFKNGHPYLFTWESFQWAVQRFPKSNVIWMQYMRFMAIYYENMNEFISLYNTYHKKPHNSLMIKTFLFYCHRCINRRNKQFCKEISFRFKEIDERIKEINELMISYWTAIENDAPALAFVLGSKLNDKFKVIEAIFNQLMGFYPNNPQIVRKYSNFLNDYTNDTRRSQFYQLLALRLSNRDRHIFDATSQSSYEMFPLIPRSMHEIQSNTETQQIPGSESGSRSLSNTNSSSIRSNDNLTSTSLMSEIDESNMSQLRELGNTITIPFIRHFILLFLLFFAIIYIACLLTSPFLVYRYLSTFDMKFDIVTRSCDIIYLLQKIPNYLMTESMIISGTYPKKEDEQFILTNSRDIHSDYLANSQQIALMSIELNNLIHQLATLIGDSFSASSKISNFWVSTRIQFCEHRNKNNYTYYSSLLEAMTSVCHSFYQYSTNYSANSIQFMNQSWFADSILNSRVVANVMISFTELICEDVLDFLHNLNTLILIINGIYAVFLIIFIPILLISLNKINAGWEYIIDSIKSLPLVSIRLVIDRITQLSTIQHKNENEQREQQGRIHEEPQQSSRPLITQDMNSQMANQIRPYNYDRLKKPQFDKYANLFNQMATSNDNSYNMIIRQRVLLVFCFFISLVSIGLLAYFSTSESKKLVVLPYRLSLSSKLNGITSQGITDILRRMSLDNNEPFWVDNRFSLFTNLMAITDQYQSGLDEFLFGHFDDELAGIVSSSKSLIEHLLMADDQWLNQTLMHDRLLLMPPLLAVVVLNQQFSHIVERSTRNEDYFSSTDYDIILFVHAINSHLDTAIFKNTIDKSYISLAHSTTRTLTITLFSISIAIFFVGLFLLILIMTNTVRIKNTSQFCITNLSMIDYQFIKRNQRILQLLSGRFDYRGTSMNSRENSNSYEVVEDKVKDCVIIVETNQFSTLSNKKKSKQKNDFDSLSSIEMNEEANHIIKFVNQKTKDFFRFEDQVYMDMPFFTLFEFGEFIVMDSDDVVTVDTTVKFGNSDVYHQMNITVVHPQDNENSNKIVVLMKSLQTDEKKLEMIKDMEDQIKTLKSKVMPPAIYKKANGAFRLTIHHVVFVVIDMSAEFNEIVAKAKANNFLRPSDSLTSFDTGHDPSLLARRSSTPIVQLNVPLSSASSLLLPTASSLLSNDYNTSNDNNYSIDTNSAPDNVTVNNSIGTANSVDTNNSTNPNDVNESTDNATTNSTNDINNVIINKSDSSVETANTNDDSTIHTNNENTSNDNTNNDNDIIKNDNNMNNDNEDVYTESNPATVQYQNSLYGGMRKSASKQVTGSKSTANFLSHTGITAPSKKKNKRLRFITDDLTENSNNRPFLSGSASSAISFDGSGYALTAGELSERFKECYDTIDGEIRRSKDAISIKNTGVACFLAFNLVNESTNVREVVLDAFDFCRRIALIYNEKNIAFKIGMAYDSSTVAGIVSEDRLIFDVYSKSVDIAYSLARKSGIASIAISDRTLDLAGDIDLSSSQHEQMLIGDTEFFYHEIKL